MVPPPLWIIQVYTTIHYDILSTEKGKKNSAICFRVRHYILGWGYRNAEPWSQTIAAIEVVVHVIAPKDFDHRHIKKNDKQCGDCDENRSAGGKPSANVF
jgi:hypothetical protein